MSLSASAQSKLQTVVELMRELSRQTDPQQAAELYGRGLRKLNLIPSDRYLSLSRRDLAAPRFRITRCTSWKQHPNPWVERDRLPLLSGGLLGEVIYGEEPVVIADLPARLSADDPAFEYLHDMKMLVALPHFDNGQAINAGVLLQKTTDFPFDQIPMMLWQANLWGRATLNLVTQQKLAAAYGSLDRELQIVGDIQRSLLPPRLPEIPGIDIAVHYRTSERAGGDYYDFFPLPENQWGIFVADVSGHGTPAAVMMAITHAIAHAHPGHPAPPGSLLGYLNKKLTTGYTRNTATFVTALYGILDPAARTLTFSSAGHPLPRIVRGGVALELPAETSLPLGISPDETYPECTVRLEPADKLLFYTDGITESFNPLGEGGLFGTRRLDAALGVPSGSAAGAIDNILAALESFTTSAAPTDDRTLLALACG